MHYSTLLYDTHSVIVQCTIVHVQYTVRTVDNRSDMINDIV